MKIKNNSMSFSNDNHVGYKNMSQECSPCQMIRGSQGPTRGNQGDMAGPATAASRHKKPAIRAESPVKVRYGKE